MNYKREDRTPLLARVKGVDNKIMCSCIILPVVQEMEEPCPSMPAMPN